MARPAHEIRKKTLELFSDAVIAERGPNFLRHMVPSQPGKRILDLSIGPIHYQDGSEWKEIDTSWRTGVAPWDFAMEHANYNAFALEDFSSGQIVKYVHPASGEDIAFEAQQLQYTNDLDQIQPIEDPQAVLAINELDKLRWTGAYGTGLDLTWECQTGRFDKRLIINSASDLPAVEQFIIDGGNPALRLQFIFQHSNGVSVWVDGIEWNEQPNNPVETSGYVEFKDSGGTVLWSFSLPRTLDSSTDPNGQETIGIFRFRKTGPNLFVEHLIPVSVLESAVYPVEVDVTIDDQVEASADDGYSTGSGSFFATSTLMHTGQFSSNPSDSWIRFVNISGLDSDATIDVATTDWYNLVTVKDALMKLSADDSESPTSPTSRSDHTGKTRTTAGVDWDEKLSEVAFNTSPSIVSVIQELADSYTPTAIQIFLDDDGSSNDDFQTFATYNRDTAEAAKLHIEYTSTGSSIEQEGFRWRDDDDSEADATWRQDQDVDDSVAKSTNIRIRTLLDSTNDPPTTQWKLQYKETSAADTAYRDVPLS